MLKVTSVKKSSGYIETDKVFTILSEFESKVKADGHVWPLMELEVQGDLKTFREIPEKVYYSSEVLVNKIPTIYSWIVCHPSSRELINDPTLKFEGLYKYKRLSDSEVIIYSPHDKE